MQMLFLRKTLGRSASKCPPHVQTLLGRVAGLILQLQLGDVSKLAREEKSVLSKGEVPEEQLVAPP